MTHEKFNRLLSNCADEIVQEKLYQTEIHNLEYFGYGIKGFTLSMIETAIELTDGKISGAEIQQIVEFAKEMLRSPVNILPGVSDTIKSLYQQYTLMIITKGDLFDQESKIAQSGLADYFDHIEIVSDKNRQVYGAILEKYSIQPDRFVMVGNSLKSDILPVLELGGHAAHVPYESTWAHEVVDLNNHHYYELKSIEGVLPLLKNLA